MWIILTTSVLWANALAIVGLTVSAYHEGAQSRLLEMKKHLRLASLIAVSTALMISSVMYEGNCCAAQVKPLPDASNSSWNSYPMVTEK